MRLTNAGQPGHAARTSQDAHAKTSTTASALDCKARSLRLTAARARQVPKKMSTGTRRQFCRSISRLSKKPLDDIVKNRIVRDQSAGQQVENLGILRRKERFEGGLDGR